MFVFLQAACICHKGRIRSNNEDNFLFDKKILPEQNNGLNTALTWQGFTLSPRLFGVFDGMGGEAFGECASFEAANSARSLASASGKDLEADMARLCQNCNLAVFQRGEKLVASRMGSTLALLGFHGTNIVCCNVGDSRIYRWRKDILEQISVDHTDALFLKKRGIQRKPGLTQYLGIDPQEILLDPHIATSRACRKDIYLICSDGLTDMVSEQEITSILKANQTPLDCTEALLQSALEHGGRDNITVIVCSIL